MTITISYYFIGMWPTGQTDYFSEAGGGGRLFGLPDDDL